MKTLHLKLRKITLLAMVLLGSMGLSAQTNVYDDIIATSPDHTSLNAAIMVAGLEGALQNETAELTVFAPTNEAFENIAAGLGTDVAGLLELPNLSDILTYHVLGTTVAAGDITNGTIVTPLNDANTLKLTVTAGGMVFVNQAMVATPDLTADNGIVHSIDAVLLPYETVVDIAIDNGFTSLTAAVVVAELLPALTDPLAEFTVFAPDNDAFDDLAEALNTDIDGLLALPNLSDILLYHVVGQAVLSSELTDGLVETLNGESVTVDLTSGVMINTATVFLADIAADNGVVHVIDEVLLPSTVGVQEIDNSLIDIYPNPATDFVNVNSISDNLESVSIISIDGKIIQQEILRNGLNRISLDNLSPGIYILKAEGTTIASAKRLVIQ